MMKIYFIYMEPKQERRREDHKEAKYINKLQLQKGAQLGGSRERAVNNQSASN